MNAHAPDPAGTPPAIQQPTTLNAADFSAESLMRMKGLTRVSVVIPARNEAATLPRILREIRAELIERQALVDELIVIDSDSTDSTAALAREAGAVVHSAAEIRPDLGWLPGKGEAMWKSLFVSTGDVIVFVDGDLTSFTADYVVGLIGPLLADPNVALVKAFYDRDLTGTGPDARTSGQGGRVTELMARPLVNAWWPELSRVIQPLAGEWSIRRDLMSSLTVPAGYGVELAVLVDTFVERGLGAIAQVDLGSRTHTHQDLASLGVMSAEVLAAATQRRYSHDAPIAPCAPAIAQPGPERGTHAGAWDVRPLNVAQRPPKDSIAEPRDTDGDGDGDGDADGDGDGDGDAGFGSVTPYEPPRSSIIEDGVATELGEKFYASFESDLLIIRAADQDAAPDTGATP